MKYILYVLGILCLSTPACAQIAKGTSTIGGSASISYTESKAGSGKNKSTTFDLQPAYGLFVIDNLCVGASIQATHRRSRGSQKFNNQELNNTDRSIGIGPFVRYYMPVNSKVYAFAHAGYALQWSKNEYELYVFGDVEDPGLLTVENKYRVSTWNASLGLSYFLTPNTALEGTLGYTGRNLKISDPAETVFYVYTHEKKSSIALGIGLRIFLRKAS